ncbi:MAG: hypothetical protein AAF367_11795 [Pseudomonadota bacterium]
MDVADRMKALSGIIRRIDGLSIEETNQGAAGVVIDDLTGITGVELLPFRRRIVRPDDLLSLDVTFQNLRLTGAGIRRRLVRRIASRPSLLIVRLQGQAIGESDYNEGSSVPETVDSPVPARLSGPSRLVFRMPDDATGLDFSVDAILEACRLWPMAFDPLARTDRFVFRPELAGEIDDLVIEASDPALIDTFEPFIDSAAATLREAGEARLCAAIMGAARRSGDAIAAALAERRTPDAAVRDATGAAFETAMKSVPRAAAGTKATARLLFEAETTATVLRDNRVAGQVGQASDIVAEIGTLVQIALAPHVPGQQVTAIEAPYRIIFSPLPGTGWSHANQPVQRTGRTELWHTRLSRRIGGMPDETVSGSKGIRPIWTPDYGGTYDANGDLNASNAAVLKGTQPTSKRRADIVRLTAGYNETVDGVAYNPRSIPADKVMLSTLGAALNLEGNWPNAPTARPGFLEVDVSAWKHISNWARDNYVRIVEEGYLLPFGHRASLITITERKFETMPGGGRGAYLRTREFIVVRERLKTYPLSGQAFQGRDFPLTEIEILTEATPPLDRGDMNASTVSPSTGEAYFPRVNNADFLFQVRGQDLGGSSFSTAVPLAFMFRSANSNNAVLSATLAAYNANSGGARIRRTMPVGGAQVQLAPITGPDAGDVVLPTEQVELSATMRTGTFTQGNPRFAPGFRQVEAVIPSLKKLVPGGMVDQPQPIRYGDIFLNNGFGAQNPASMFAELVNGLPLAFGGGGGKSSEDTGGFFEPNMGVEALSAVKGAVGDATRVAAGVFDPSEFFQGAKVLGSILIEDLLNGVTSSILGDDAPEIFNVELDSPPRAEARIKWNTTIDNSAIPLFVPRAGGNDTVFDIDVKNTVFLNGDPPTTRVQSTMTNFKVNLFGFITLWFDRLEFIKEPGKKADVNPDLHPEDAVVFGGPLEFVNKLSDLIPDAGFADPPVLDISPAGIVAGYDLDIPNLQVGVLSLTNMSLGARLRLPFDGDPVSVRFNFAEREDPFNLTISLLGGGGFFAIGIDSGGVREIEAAVEFGAAIAFDIGVASGGVYVKAGIYFHWLVEGDAGQVELTGYVEMGGELSVLGLITVSVTFYLALSYHKAGGMAELRGTAKLTIEIEILFFSTSVTLLVERRFAGSPADPKFIDFIPDQATWNRYAAAFA